MCDSGLSEFPYADDKTLRDGMREAARLGLPVAVHAESEEMTRTLAVGMTGSSARGFSRVAPRRGRARRDCARRRSRWRDRREASHRACQHRQRRRQSGRRRARAAWTCRSRPARTICFSRTRISTPSASRRSARLRCAITTSTPALWGEVLDGRVDLIASDHSPRRAVAEERRRLPHVVGRRRGRAVDARRAARARARRPPPPVRAHLGVDRGKPGGAVSNSLERHA